MNAAESETKTSVSDAEQAVEMALEASAERLRSKREELDKLVDHLKMIPTYQSETKILISTLKKKRIEWEKALRKSRTESSRNNALKNIEIIKKEQEKNQKFLKKN